MQNKLQLKGSNYDALINKFKQREDQTSLEEALVYLKLRQLNCENKRALVFAQKKQKCIDGTIQKDGPPGFKKLAVLKPQSHLINGWLRGQKLKYSGTTGYTQFLRNNQSVEKREITKYNQKSRLIEDQLRKTRSQSLVNIDLSKPKQTLQKINNFKQDASKEREFRNMYVQFQGMRLDQTTKNFFKEAEAMDSAGLIVKMGVFDHIIGVKQLKLSLDEINMRGKTLTKYEIEGSLKRKQIIDYQDNIKQQILKQDRQKYSKTSFDSFKSEEIKKQREQRSIRKKRVLSTQKNKKQLNDNKIVINSVKTASNALILMDSKQLQQTLETNKELYNKKVTKYKNFYNSIQKVIDQQFLNKRKYSSDRKKLKINQDKQIEYNQNQD